MSSKRRSGDACTCGGGHYRTYSSRNVGEFQIRYLECRACGLRFRSVVKAEEVVRKCSTRRTKVSDGIRVRP